MRTIAVACLVSLLACLGRQDVNPRRPQIIETCFECPHGFECTDSPEDRCTPATHGEDCGGICVLPADPIIEQPGLERHPLPHDSLETAEPVLDGYNLEEPRHRN